MASNPLDELTPSEVQGLIQEFRSGALKHGVTVTSLKRSASGLSQSIVGEFIRLIEDCSWTSEQVVYLLESLASARGYHDKRSHIFDLVLSGPKTEAADTRDTSAVYRELIATAKEEVLMASYAIYNGESLFEPLVEKQKHYPGFKISIYLDIPRKYNDTTLSSQIVAQYKQQFAEKEWPSKKLPDLYYYRESLNEDWKIRASMHAKVIIVDKKRVLITSANLTNAAQLKNIETGVILEDINIAQRLTNYFSGLAKEGIFKQV